VGNLVAIGDDAGLGASSQNPRKMRNENALHHFIRIEETEDELLAL